MVFEAAAPGKILLGHARKVSYFGWARTTTKHKKNRLRRHHSIFHIFIYEYDKSFVCEQLLFFLFRFIFVFIGVVVVVVAAVSGSRQQFITFQSLATSIMPLTYPHIQLRQMHRQINHTLPSNTMQILIM